MLFFRTVRKSDGKRVKNKIPIGLVQDFPDKSCVWAEVERQHLHINQVDFRGCVTFADWVFPSFRLKGRQPRVANMLVEDYLRPAAVKAGILSSHRDDEGRLVDDDPRRFGFHNLRHSLASFLVRTRTDPKTVQTLLRHSDVKLTLQCYTHSVSEDRMAATGAMLTAIFSHAADGSGLKADGARGNSSLSPSPSSWHGTEPDLAEK